MIDKIKSTKYLLETFALAFLFMLSFSPVFASQINVDNILNLVNKSREERGISDLVLNDKLTTAAQEKLTDMIDNGYFAHTSPSGVNPWHWFEKAGYNYQYAGENLAINFLTAEDENQAWMYSPAHRKNILNPVYNDTGIAVGAGEINGKMSIIAVQVFGTLTGSAGTANNKNNFSVNPKNDFDKNSLAPQVLSAKNSNTGNGDSGNPAGGASNFFWSKALDDLVINQPATSEMIAEFSYLILLIAIALIPLAFVSVAIEDITRLHKIKRQSEVV